MRSPNRPLSDHTQPLRPPQTLDSGRQPRVHGRRCLRLLAILQRSERAAGIAYSRIAWPGFAAGRADRHVALAGAAVPFALGPLAGHALSMLLVWRSPLDERRHAELRAALAMRDGTYPVHRIVRAGVDCKETAGQPRSGTVVSQTQA